jgi:hypothetical protein
LLFCNTWQRVSSNCLDMLQFVLGIRSAESSRQHGINFSVSDVQPAIPTPILSPLPETESTMEDRHSLTIELLQFGILTSQSHPLNDRSVLTM